jgi:hypothetical protein
MNGKKEHEINKAKYEGKSICPNCKNWSLISYSKADICDNCDFEEGY